jgi:hypothetical protein
MTNQNKKVQARDNFNSYYIAALVSKDKDSDLAKKHEKLDFIRDNLYSNLTRSNPVITTTQDPKQLQLYICWLMTIELDNNPEAIPDPDALKSLRVVRQSQSEADPVTRARAEVESVEVFPKDHFLYARLEKLAAERREVAPQFDR